MIYKILYISVFFKLLIFVMVSGSCKMVICYKLDSNGIMDMGWVKRLLKSRCGLDGVPDPLFFFSFFLNSKTF